MQIQNLTPGGFASTCYLVTEGTTALLIDCSAPAAAITAALADAGAHLAAILLTHGHFDHILTLADVVKATDAPVYIGRDDCDMPADSRKNAFSAFFGYDHTYPAPTHTFEDGDRLFFDAITVSVLATPGHTPGSSTLLIGGIAFTGDTLFANGYGRTDLPGGSFIDIRRSLEKLSKLPPDTPVYPGHGEPTVIGAAFRRL